MTLTVGAYKAKTNFSKLLDQVSAGNDVTVLRHGVPAAIMSPIPSQTPASVIMEKFAAARVGLQISDSEITDLISEGRR